MNPTHAIRQLVKRLAVNVRRAVELLLQMHHLMGDRLHDPNKCPVMYVRHLDPVRAVKQILPTLWRVGRGSFQYTELDVLGRR